MKALIEQSTDIRLLTNRVGELETNLKQREDMMGGMTKGYMKDIAHMREMMFRKQKIDRIDFFEVQYFDSTQGLDEETLALVNDKLRTLKTHFELKTRDLLKFNVQLTNHNEKLKAHLAQLLPAQPSLNDLLKRVFKEEENPYVLWKQFQELQGNQFFFDVFEKQRPEFGINYKEVNAMLMSKRVYEIEYTAYKQQNDDQFCDIIFKTQQYLDALREEVSVRDEELKRIKQEFETLDKRKFDRLLQTVKVHWDERGFALREALDKERQEFLNENTCEDQQNNIDSADPTITPPANDQLLNSQQKKHQPKLISPNIINALRSSNGLVRMMLQRWACASLIMKYRTKTENIQPQTALADLQLMLNMSESAQKQRIEQLEQEIKRIQGEKNKSEESLNNAQLRIIVLEEQLSSTQMEKQLEKNAASLLKQRSRGMKEELLQSQALHQLYQKQIDNIFKHLGSRLEDSQFPSLNLNDESKTSTKAFKSKIAKVNAATLRRIREELNLGDKAIQTAEASFRRIPEPKQVQTDIMNLDWEIFDSAALAQKISQQEQSKDEIDLESVSLRQISVNPLLQSQHTTITNTGTNQNARAPSAISSNKPSRSNTPSRNSSSMARRRDQPASQLSKSTTSKAQSIPGVQNAKKNSISIRKTSTIQTIDDNIEPSFRKSPTISQTSARNDEMIEYESRGMQTEGETAEEIQERLEEQIKEAEEILIENEQLMTTNQELKSEIALLNEQLKILESLTSTIPTAAATSLLLPTKPTSPTETPLPAKQIKRPRLDSESLAAAARKRTQFKQNKIQKKVFDRLFLDSKEKAERLDTLKHQLEKMESFQWEEVLSMLNLLQKFSSSSNEKSERINEHSPDVQSPTSEQIQSQQKQQHQQSFDNITSLQSHPFQSQQPMNLLSVNEFLTTHVSSPVAALTEYHMKSLPFTSVNNSNNRYRASTATISQTSSQKQNQINHHSAVFTQQNQSNNSRIENSCRKLQQYTQPLSTTVPTFTTHESTSNFPHTRLNTGRSDGYDLSTFGFSESNQFIGSTTERIQKGSIELINGKYSRLNTEEVIGQSHSQGERKKQRDENLQKSQNFSRQQIKLTDLSDTNNLYSPQKTINSTQAGNSNPIRHASFTSAFQPRHNSLETQQRNNFQSKSKPSSPSSGNNLLSDSKKTKRKVINTENLLKQKQQEEIPQQYLAKKRLSFQQNTIFIPETISSILKQTKSRNESSSTSVVLPPHPHPHLNLHLRNGD